ncbi:MAG TPA: hypothetical protein VK553_11395, partial [Candidatus Nitrosopolaris rasttigaisensis]|nr:hypothetical protein [Candidatus Nitrosopolaris rasttigaisensis]
PQGEQISINSLAKLLSALCGKPFDPIYMPDRPREVKVAHCLSTKAKELLGYEQKITLMDGMCRLLEWIQEKGPKPFDYHLDLEIINDKTPLTWTEKLI